MKKLTNRDQMLLVILAVFGILTLFYLYVYTPFQTKSAALKTERDSLTAQIQAKDTKSLDKMSKQLKDNLNQQIEEKKKVEKQRMITSEQKDNLLGYIGGKANQLGINLVKFEEKPSNANFTYKVSGYDIQARGDSKDIVLFLNSIYSYYNYCQVTDVNLRKVVVTAALPSGSSDAATSKTSDSNWDADYLQLVSMDIPPYVSQKTDTTESTDTSSTSGSGSVSKTPQDIELQLDFSLYFILSD